MDCLAIAAGTAHGKYPEGFVPQIKLSQSSGKAVNFKPIYNFEDKIAKTYNQDGE